MKLRTAATARLPPFPGLIGRTTPGPSMWTLQRSRTPHCSDSWERVERITPHKHASLLECAQGHAAVGITPVKSPELGRNHGFAAFRLDGSSTT